MFGKSQVLRIMMDLRSITTVTNFLTVDIATNCRTLKTGMLIIFVLKQ